MQKLRKNKKFVLGASIILTAVMILSATYAWFTANDSVDNEFKTGGIPTDSVKIWEIFEKPDEWKPGEEIQKDVGVTNLGKEAIFVRASFEETIKKLKSDGTNLNIIDATSKKDPSDDKFIPVPVTNMEGKADWKLAKDAGYTIKDLDASDKLYVRTLKEGDKEKIFYSAISSQGGAIKADFKLKDKEIQAENVAYRYYEKDAIVTKDWIKTEFVKAGATNVAATDPLIKLAYHDNNMIATPESGEKWFYNEKDGWFYYMTPLQGGEISKFFLNSVTLDSTANNSYQYLDFKLTVKTEGIQGTGDALVAWDITKDSNPDLFTALTKNLK